MGAWFLGIIRGLFAAIDKVVVWLVESLYSLIFDIASVQIFTNKELGDFASRITVILTIFMLFKLSFSFLNYIINPDNMTDKGKGVSKLIQNIAVSLVLLVSYQFIFDKAMELQQKIIDNETIPKLIFGAGAGTKASQGAKNPGTLSFALFSSFVLPNSELPEACSGYAFKTNPADNGCDLSSYTVDVTDYTDPKGNKISADQPDAVNKQFNKIVEYKDTHSLLGHMISWKEGEIYAFDYKFIISTACGVFAALVLLSFCFDVAIRTIKFAFLRLIAPIPIISYIDPNKGEGVFKKWLSTVGKTYADLFIRLIAIFFAIYIIQIITAKGSLVDLNNQPINNPFVVIFIILGALMFAKQFPKLIQDITGISLDSKMQLNPFKRVRDEALGGKAMTAAAAGLAGAGLTAGGNLLHRGANFKKDWKSNGGGAKGFAKTALGMAGSSVAGAASGLWNTSRQAYSSGKITQGIAKGMEKANTNRTQREIGQEEGATSIGIMKAKAADKLGLETEGQRMKREVENTKNIKKSMDSVDQFIESDIVKKHSLYNVASFEQAVKAKNRYDSLQKTSVEEVRQNANSRYNEKIQDSRNAVTTASNKLNEIYSKYGLNSNSDINQLINDNIPAYNEVKSAREAFTKAQQDYSNLESQRDAYVNDAVNKHLDELNTASQDAFNTMKTAKEEYFKMAMDENQNSVNKENSSAQIKATVDTVRRTVDKSSQYDDDTRSKFNSTSLDQMMKETKKLNNEAIEIENSEEYRKAQADTTYAGIKEGSYNNYKDPRATK